jgi:hypothetical protein
MRCVELQGWDTPEDRLVPEVWRIMYRRAIADSTLHCKFIASGGKIEK